MLDKKLQFCHLQVIPSLTSSSIAHNEWHNGNMNKVKSTAHKPREKHKANMHKKFDCTSSSHYIIHRPLNAPRDLMTRLRESPNGRSS